MSARRVKGVQRALATLLRPALAGALLLALGAGAGPAAAASPPLVAPVARAVDAPDPALTEPALELVAAPVSTSVAPDAPLALRVTVRNTGGSASAAGTLVVGLDGGTRATLSALEAWFSGGEQSAVLPTVAEAALPALDAGAAAVIEVPVPAAAAGLAGEWGPRLVTATAMMGDAAAAASRTAITFAPPESAPAVSPVRVVTPFSTPGSESALLSAEELAELTGPDGSLTRTLDAVEGTGAALGVDPRIIASVRALGTAAPESATLLLERLAGLSNPTFALAWADADPTATVLARGIPLPAVEGAGAPLDAALLEGATALPPAAAGPDPAAPADPAPEQSSAAGDPAASPSPAASDPAEAPATVTLAELAAWPHDLDGWVWPRAGGLSAAGIEQLVAGGAGTIIASDAQLGDGVGSAARSGGATLAVADESASRAAIGITTATVQQQAQASTAELAALLAARAVELPGSATLLALDRTAAQSVARLDGLLTAIDALGWAALTPLGQPAASAPETIVSEGALPEGLGDAVGSALDAEAADRAYARIAVDPAAITDIRRLELLAALSLGWGEEAAEAAQRFVTDSAELRTSAQLVETPSITLFSDRLSVPVTVQNGLGTPIVVYVHVESATGQLRVLEARVETLIEGTAQAVARVPVQSLTNGDVDITITVRDADGTSVAGPITVPLSLQAGWETAGIVALSVAIAGLFVTGLARDIRRRRVRRAEASASPV